MQHLAYQPLLPTGNKYLQQKWDKASYDIHREKVKSAKATINTTPPRTYGHLALKLKKQKLEEQQMMKIQRENDMLLEKISYIMRTTGSIDNSNYYERKSLGRERRQLELLRITKENQVILFRLTQCRPHYNVRSWNEDWLKTLKLMDSIAHYPRGRANYQKGQENSSKRSSDCDSEEKTSTDATGHNSKSKLANGKAVCEGREGKKATNNKEDAGTQIHKEAGTHIVPKPPKCSSPDTPELPSAPDPITNTPNKHPGTAESCSSSDRSEMSNTPHTTHTSRPSTPETHEQDTTCSEYKDTSEEG